MKQGRASRDVFESWARDPVAKAVSPAGVSQIGSSMGNHATEKGRTLTGAVEPMYKGRGFEAPRNANQTTHKAGSQGER